MAVTDLHAPPQRHTGFWQGLRQGLPGILTVAVLWFGFFGLVAMRVLD